MAKKILMLTHEFPPFRGGIGTYASQLAGAAHRLGHEITVLAPDFGQKLAREDRETYPYRVTRYRSGLYSLRDLPQMLWRTWRRVRHNGCDIIHSVDWPYILAMSAVNRINPVPFQATVYGTDLLSCTDCRQARYLGLDGFFADPERVFAISDFTKSLYREKCPEVASDRIVSTPLGVDRRWFEDAPNARDIRQKYGVPSRHKIMLTVARLDERKGHRTVLKALAKLPERLKNRLAYIIVGTGNDRAYMTELKKLASLSGTVFRFAGATSTSELHALYASASVFCMPGEPNPKKVEGFGLAYLEAAAQGVPSIASRVGAVPEVVLDNKTGLLVEPLDVDAVATAIEKLLYDDMLRESLGNAAREHAGTFTWRRCAELTYGED